MRRRRPTPHLAVNVPSASNFPQSNGLLFWLFPELLIKQICNELKPTRKSPAMQRYLCLAIACIVVFNLFFIGAKPVAVGLFLPPWDKVAHFVVFSGITVLLWFGLDERLQFSIVPIVIAIGALDEIHQTTLPGRQGDGLDFGADAAAALCTAGILYFIEHRRRKNGRPENNDAAPTL